MLNETVAYVLTDTRRTMPPHIASGVHRMKLHWADIAVIATYFVLSLSVGVWVGLSIFASNIGSEHFIGLAGSASVSGIAAILFEWGVIPLVLMMAWVFLPVYINAGIYTMPEYLYRRYGGHRLRIYLSLLALVTYLVSCVSVDLFSGALFIQQALQWDIYAGVVVLLGLTSLYTICGGLATVILTDVLAVIVMVAGGLVVTVIGLKRVGGYRNLQTLYMQAIPRNAFNQTNSSCGLPREDAFQLFRDPLHADYPWVGTVIRVYLGGLWFWCANQLIVQRALAAKNIKHAKAGALLAGYTKFFPFLIMTIPGMISRVLFPDEVACTDVRVCREVCGNPSGCSNIAYPKLVVELLPAGARGLVLAVMVAAVVSSLTSLFNSASTIFTLDIWRKIRPRCGDIELLIVGRLIVVVLAGLSVVWIPIMQEQEGGQIMKYATKAVGYLGAPTSAIFILSIFWPRITEPAAFWSMVVSAFLGILRLVLDFVFKQPPCGEVDTRPNFISKFHGYYYFTMQLGITFLCAFVLSMLTKPIPKYKLDGLTFWTRHKMPHYDKEQSNKLNKESNSSPSKDSIENDKEGIEMNQMSGCASAKNDSANSKDIIETPTPLWKRTLEIVCGIPNSVSKDEQKQARAEECYEQRQSYLHEPRMLRIILNINAVIILVALLIVYICFR